MFLPDPIKSENLDHFVPSAMNYLNKSAYNSYQNFSNISTQYSVEKSNQTAATPPTNPTSYLNFYNNFNYNPNYHHHHYYYMNELEYQQQNQIDSQNLKTQNWSRKSDEEYLNPYTPPVSSTSLTSLDYDFEVPQQKSFDQPGKLDGGQVDNKQMDYFMEGIIGGAHSESVKNKSVDFSQKEQEYGSFWCQNEIESLCKISKNPGNFKDNFEVSEDRHQKSRSIKRKQKGEI